MTQSRDFDDKDGGAPKAPPTRRQPAPQRDVDRLEREAAALRENLRRRKDQARARAKPSAD
ncbi:hypothetical protein [Rhodospirillum rubrum]|uniref:Uncharacterized protein n=1 Tax=Rhodospirillum rubrum (strain ATCC 11170 / ATH 1.1.1 / DSM 467 / LMG 4362 / NCIMB 8255 / S1) TaxID=269796 RepID=Q2RQ66_RHORT|nr:hypothetical protein [Rhodospirillum rubrum]ABC23729.1 hypothetical protein Rru_A2932 [Rhodospirillum rubrum ATCC 11170]AEO49468.1 hypothetical protein F11_15030 [Rhodospirillum rubrum F11]MBK5955405.1 hypothetical protein [Rhodospirillum rubrum]QXG79685.1 hypothetical protein KUL73_15110 [Rhodospirillum rubrum]